MSTIKDTEMKVDAAETIEAPAVATTVPLLTSASLVSRLIIKYSDVLTPATTNRRQA